MKPSIWGPHTWKTIHYIALAYPRQPSPEDRANYAAFFHSLGHVLPCSTCSRHFLSLLMEVPLDAAALRSSDTLFEWTVKVHNRVNLTLGKPTLSVDQALRRLKQKGERSYRMRQAAIILLVIILLLLVLLLVVIHMWH